MLKFAKRTEILGLQRRWRAEESEPRLWEEREGALKLQPSQLYCTRKIFPMLNSSRTFEAAMFLEGVRVSDYECRSKEHFRK